MSCLTSNRLKIIAIITMVVDHIGYYFAFDLPVDAYAVLRIIGRITMPIFSFLLVEGYAHTGNFKKYISRLLIFALITQVLISLLGVLNNILIPSYNVEIIYELNILFSFVLSLIVMYLLDKTLESLKGLFTSKKDIRNILMIMVNIVMIVICINIFIFVPIDYDLLIPIITILMFICKKIMTSRIKEDKIGMWGYKISVFVIVIISSSIVGGFNIFMILAIPFIFLYNGKLGKRSKIVKYLYYTIFPLQHFILYLLAMLYYNYYIM